MPSHGSTTDMTIITRRQALIGGFAGSGLLLTGCSRIFQADSLTESASFQRVLAAAQSWTPATQRFLHAGGAVVNWRLRSDGMVTHPLAVSIAELRRLPARSQITRHGCVEGWSAIGGWTGVPLALLMRAARVRPG